jgi:transcriptional regulator with PAS, ATPase and Fis domain
MPIELQAKLLSFLQDRFFYRVGGNKSINVNVRVVAATNQDLTRLVKEKLFREDLFFRINVVPLHIPPLRQRPDDIPLLIEYFLNHIAEYRGTEPYSMDEEAKAALLQYDWPGNVREIENVMERTTAFSSGTLIKKADLPPEILGSSDSGDLNPFSLSGLTLESIEKMAVEQALADCKGNKTKAAKKLGISERSIYNKINRYNISPI